MSWFHQFLASLLFGSFMVITISCSPIQEHDLYNFEGFSSEPEGWLTPDHATKFMSEPSEVIVSQNDTWAVLKRLNSILNQTTTDLKELLNLQKKEFEVNSQYQSSWNTGTTSYKKKEYFLNSTVPAPLHIAVLAYTQNLYGSFNRLTRNIKTREDIAKYPFKSYFRLLNMGIDALRVEQKRFQSDRIIHYRGIQTELLFDMGQLVTFQSYLSTSKVKGVAEAFGSKTIFEFHGNLTEFSMSTEFHTNYLSEREVLLQPFNVYQVTDKAVRPDKKLHYILSKYEPKDEEKVTMLSIH